MTRYRRCRGNRLECLEETWAVYCGRSGDTLQLNHEAASVLEVLADGPMEGAEVSRLLATASDAPQESVTEQLQALWPQLLTLGLVEEVR